MDIIYQYYNEVVLFFADYDVDFRDGIIVIPVPDDNKPFDSVCEKIITQLHRIAETLDIRDKDVVVKIERTNASKEVVLEKQD